MKKYTCISISKDTYNWFIEYFKDLKDYYFDLLCDSLSNPKLYTRTDIVEIAHSFKCVKKIYESARCNVNESN